MKYVVNCFVCNKPEEIELNVEDVPFHTIIYKVVYEKDWAMSECEKGIFLCCDECYDKCFDLSYGGKVGLVKPEYYNLYKKI